MNIFNTPELYTKNDEDGKFRYILPQYKKLGKNYKNELKKKINGRNKVK